MNAYALCTAIAVLSATAANAQEVDLSSPFAASEAFYSALSTLDIAAMEGVWAQTDDVVYVGPRSTTVAVGWEAVRAAWEASNNSFISRSVDLTESHMAMNGDIAWEVGIEDTHSQRTGEIVTTDNRNLTANVYQRIDGQWLMVSHVVHRVPETLPVTPAIPAR
jgi:ketosteroid isomerase-like protein